MTSAVVGGARVEITADLAAFGREARAGIEPALKQLGPIVDKALQATVPGAERAGLAMGRAFATAAQGAVEAGLARLGTTVGAQLGTLDRSLIGAGGAADKAAVGMERASKSTTAAGGAAERASRIEQIHAAALRQVTEISAQYAGESVRVQQAGLREAAGQQRLAAAHAEAGSAERAQAAEVARLASAQASAIGASQRLAVAQKEGAASSSRFAAALGGTVKMAGQLGLLLGAFELVKKGIDITKEANNFHRAMVQVQTNADVSAAEVTKASTALLAMAGPVAAAPDELATAWYHAKSVGLDYAHSIDTTRIAAEGAKVGHADLEETMNALTSTVASNIPGVKNMSSAMGQLIAIVGSGDMKLSDLNQALGSGILTVVKGYGLSLTDVGAALATFGDNNIRGANAATMLRMSVQAMAVPAKAGRDELNRLGLSATTLRDDMQTGGLNKAILDLKAHLDKSGVSAVQVGAILTEVFGKRAGPGVAVLVGQVDRLQSKFKILRDSGASFGAKWQATTQTASFALSRFGHTIEAAGIALTAKLGPSIASATSWLGTTLPHAVATLWAIWGPTWRIIGTVAMGALAVVGAVVKTFGTALGALGGFLSHNTALVTGLATAVLTLWGAFKLAALVTAGLRLIGPMLTRIGIAAEGARAKMAGLTAGQVGMGVFAASVGLVTMAWEQNAQKVAAAKALTDEYTSALQQSNGAINASIQAMVRQKLASDGVYDAATKYGVSQRDATAAALGNVDAQKRIAAATHGNFDAMNQIFGKTMQQNDALTSAQRHYKQAATAVGVHTAATKTNTAAVDQNAYQLQYNIDAHGNLITTTVKAGSALDNTTAAMARQTMASAILKNALDYLNGVNESVEQTTDAFNISLGQLASKTALASTAAGKHSRSLNQSTVAGAQNRQMLVGLIDQAKAHAQAVADDAHQNGKSLPASLAIGNASLRTFEGRIRAAAAQVGLGTKATSDLIASMGRLAQLHVNPKVGADTSPAQAKINALTARMNAIRQNRVPNIKANSNQAQGMIADLQARINALHDKTIDIYVATHQTTAKSVTNKLGQTKYRAAGGYLGDTTVVGEKGPEVITREPGGYYVHAADSATSRAFAGVAKSLSNRPALHVAPGPDNSALLAEISRKLDMLAAIPGIGPAVSDALHGISSRSSVYARTQPAGRGF